MTSMSDGEAVRIGHDHMASMTSMSDWSVRLASATVTMMHHVVSGRVRVLLEGLSNKVK